MLKVLISFPLWLLLVQAIHAAAPINTAEDGPIEVMESVQLVLAEGFEKNNLIPVPHHVLMEETTTLCTHALFILGGW